MTWQSRGRDGGRKASFVPRIEALETRDVPTANITVSGSALFITPAHGVSLNLTGENVVILDNGTNAINNVIVIANGHPFRPNTLITDIIITGSSQADTVAYNLTGDLTGTRNVFANLGAGDDRFDAFLRRNLLANSQLNLTVLGGAGNDTINSTTVAQLGANASLNIFFDGGSGNDKLTALTTSFVAIAPTASYNVALEGGSGNDGLFTNYQGKMDGTLNLWMDGAGGNDVLSGVYTLIPGSIGTMPPALLSGGPGNDNLTLIIDNHGIGQSNNSIIDGGSGFNADTRTTNVLSFNCQSDTVV
jgi:hypothetical protein